ncbi:glycosyl hydrolase family 8 [Alkalibacterium pelagium]|uniref:Glucanase n=1 Tax=Alkalibacterium pelagium TaxID=426702 RepID=A0A1H7KHJ8_9LACT|nr:glycosyl hydrolase family 8 [Alkalibacterium pelagium]GEN50742.1 licheninase [Alkalibacterium pelagium]SEK86278.1 Endo-1,4-beta-D-glucanase Y [Alkalibacterium pelagium]
MYKFIVLLPVIFLLISCRANEEREISYPEAIDDTQRKSDTLQAFDLWQDRYVRAIGHDQFYVSYDEEDNTVSEAHGYGMLIMVLGESHLGLDTRSVFDGMFHYAKAHPSDRNPAFMAWKQIRQADGTMTDYRIGEHTGSATDGDMDIAYALLLADQLWGSEGTIDYEQEALTVIHALMEATVNQDEWVIKLGDWVADDDPVYGQASRTSDWMIGHLATFYDVTDDERWIKVSDRIIELTTSIQSQFSPETGLLPDFVWKEGDEWVPVEPEFLERETDPYYSYNAARVPWRFAEGYFKTRNEEIKQSLERMNTWLKETAQNDPSNIKAGYTLSGEPLASYTDMTFIAPFAISALINDDHDEWFKLLWEDMTMDLGPDETGNYFSDTIRLLVMLAMEEAASPLISLTD